MIELSAFTFPHSLHHPSSIIHHPAAVRAPKNFRQKTLRRRQQRVPPGKLGAPPDVLATRTKTDAVYRIPRAREIVLQAARGKRGPATVRAHVSASSSRRIQQKSVCVRFVLSLLLSAILQPVTDEQSIVTLQTNCTRRGKDGGGVVSKPFHPCSNVSRSPSPKHATYLLPKLQTPPRR